MTNTDRRLQISKGDTAAIKKGDVFYGRRGSENVVVVEVLDSRYARIVNQDDVKKSRLWRLTYLASAACDLQPHISPDNKTVEAWQAKK